MFKKVCIIGCGLIGSSIARAIKKNNLSSKIVSSNRSDLANKKVIELKIVDDSSSDTKKMAQESDLLEETIRLERLFFFIALAKEDPIKPHPIIHTFLNIILKYSQ